MNLPIIRALAAVLGLLAVPLTGAAQDRPDDPVPPGVVIVGPVRLTPSLVLKDMGVDNNVFNDAVDPKRDFTMTVTPRADVGLRMRRLRFGVTAATDYVYYRKYSSERGTNTMAQGRVDLDLGALKPYASIEGTNTRGRLNPEVDARARHRDVVYATGVAVKIAARTSLLANVQHSRMAFDPDAPTFRGIDLADSFNGRRRSVDGGVGFALTPITSFSVLVAREQQRFAFSPARDSNSWRVSPTFTFSPTGLLTGSATLGYRRFDAVSPALPDYSGLVSVVNIGATIYTRHQMQARFSRDVQYSYDTASAYYLNTGGAITWTYLLAGPVDVRGTGGRTGMDYSVAGDALGLGHETVTTYGGGVGYRFSNRARLGVTVEWLRRDSNRELERSYRNHRILAGLTWGTTL